MRLDKCSTKVGSRAFVALDCFSGCGGLSKGLKSAGYAVIAAVELRYEAREAHLLNNGKSAHYSDIRRINPVRLMRELGIKPRQIDLLAGCPPCQGFSTMRTCNGSDRVNDPRNKLIFDFVRLAVALQPKTILIENVPALLKNWRLAEAKRRLRRAGYHWIVADIRNAADFGVPQRRRRMILRASRLGPNTLPEGDPKNHVTVRNAIGRLGDPSTSRNRLHRLHMHHSPVVMDRIRRIPKDGGSRSALGTDAQLPCHKKLEGEDRNGVRDVYGRMKWDDVAPTITRFCHNPSKGRFLHPEYDRAITIYEAMLLQSFPKDYKFPANLTMTQIASMIGEALPPKFAEAQARHIAAHLEEHRKAAKK